MTKGLKVWLWLVLVVNAVFCLGSVAMAFLVPGAWVSVLLEVLIIAGTGMLLFARRRAGFYLICGSEALSLAVNIIARTCGRNQKKSHPLSFCAIMHVSTIGN